MGIFNLLYLPLEKMKRQLKDFSDEELRDYVELLSLSRKQGPKKVKRSQATGAPKGGTKVSPMGQAHSALKDLPEEEREEILRALQDN